MGPIGAIDVSGLCEKKLHVNCWATEATGGAPVAPIFLSIFFLPWLGVRTLLDRAFEANPSDVQG